MQVIEIKNNLSSLNLTQIFTELGWQDSNLRMAESKSAALPLGDTPKLVGKIKMLSIGQEGIRTPDTVVRSHVL